MYRKSMYSCLHRMNKKQEESVLVLCFHAAIALFLGLKRMNHLRESNQSVSITNERIHCES